MQKYVKFVFYSQLHQMFACVLTYGNMMDSKSNHMIKDFYTCIKHPVGSKFKHYDEVS